MLRLGLKVPETVLVPYKNPVDHGKYAYTARRYNKPFDLDAIAGQIGYPLYMKPYDGGGWREVSRVRNPAELHRASAPAGPAATVQAWLGRPGQWPRPEARQGNAQGGITRASRGPAARPRWVPG